MSPTRRHAHAAGKAPRPARLGVLTLSDSRRGEEDESGAAIVRFIEEAGHLVIMRGWTGDVATAARAALEEMLGREDLDAVIVTGGTGLAPTDQAPEALAPLVDRWLPGFGEAFRALSVPQVGSAAWLSRAAAAVARGRVVFLLPGSTRAVTLAMVSLIMPELVHALRLTGRFKEEDAP